MTFAQPRLQILPPAEFTPRIGSLVAMLEHSRASLIETVAGLSVDALEHQHDEKANPIGAMLAHIAAMEWFYQVASIDQRQATAEEWGTWGPFLRLAPGAWSAAKGMTVEQHIERLAQVREKTLAGLATKNDEWLTGTFALPWTPEPANHHWAWYHVIEDELNHRGQIRWLKSRLPG